MKTKIDIKKIHVLNFFENVTHVKATYCFTYGDFLLFFVNQKEIKKIKRYHQEILAKKLGKRIKIIPLPTKKDFNEINKFLKVLDLQKIYKKLILREKELFFFIPSIKAKAIFFGKNKKKFHQLQEILKNFFGVKIVVK
ncbi:MAG: hypothetical protein NZ889_02600 [Candidatus Pacearchaeota archaeon]|nr:hypothetical protein [Candidatus Pacearchaeota archaeon]